MQTKFQGNLFICAESRANIIYKANVHSFHTEATPRSGNPFVVPNSGQFKPYDILILIMKTTRLILELPW